MPSNPAVGVILVFVFVFGIAAGLSTLGFNFFSRVDASGAVLDSPTFFIFLILVGVVTALLLHWIYSARDQENPFSIVSFLNSVFSAILLGGLVHELTHVLLIRHPTQFNVHFGDANAIFSTCCLAPGELPNEEIAYLIQFLVMVSWVYFSRETFFEKRVEAKSRTTKKKGSTTKTIPSDEEDDSADEEEADVEREWRRQRDWLHSKLEPRSKPKSKSKHSKSEKGFVNVVLNDLDRLKIMRSR